MIDAINSWMSSTRAGMTYLVLLAAGLVLYGLAKLLLRSDGQSLAGRTAEVLAFAALATAAVLSFFAQSFNE